MKKTISVFILIVLLAGGAGYFIHLKQPHALGDLQAAGFVPSDTVALLEITDFPRTKTRWKETALYQISQEPAVAAFLAKPKTLVPQNKQVDRLASFQKLDPKEVFLAITGQGAAGVKGVAGFDYTGDKKDAVALVADLKSDLAAKYPDGKSDIQQYGTSEIETFTHDAITVATTFHGQWFFAANDLDLLKSTLDRVDGKGDASTSLRESATYKLCIAKMPADSDAMAYVQTKGIVDSLALMLESLPNADLSSLDEMKKVQAISAATKLDGEKMREAMYVYRPGGEARPPMALNSLPFTSPDTLIYYAVAPYLNKAPVLPNPAQDVTGIFGVVRGLADSLAQAGLGFDDFKAAFGPEWAMVTNWGANSQKAGWLLTLDVRDRAKAQKFIDTLAVGWPKSEVGDAIFYAMPQSPQSMIRITPVLALTDKALVFGIDLGSVEKAVADAKTDKVRIDKGTDFQEARGLVGNPTDAFGYIDTRALFEKLYGLATSPMYLMAITFGVPHLADYVDLGKLPPASAISKHLSPMVYTQIADENGILMESAGPVTFTEVMLGVGAGLGYTMATQLPPGMLHFTPPARATPTATPAAGQPDSASNSPRTDIPDKQQTF